MSITRIVPDLTREDADRIIAMVKVDNGTFEEIEQGDGKFTIIARYPEPESPVDLPPETSNEFGWTKIAWGELGQKEATASADNPRIVEYHASTRSGPRPDSVPWCSSFVNFCIEKSGIQGTDSALARSWAQWGRSIDSLVPGCVVVLRRGDPPQGHVGFFVGMDDHNRVKLLGGNQSDAVNIASFDADRIIARRLPATSAVSNAPTNLNKWIAALTAANTSGASANTASQDGLNVIGVEASHKMAENDLSEARALNDKFQKAGIKFDVPAAVLAAIASRESRCGKVLTADGAGDAGHAFGIMQVDRRHHTPRGLPDPKSFEHIEQAAEIFARFRSQVKSKHPTWADKHVLQGAAVAYNSGLSNVQTIAHMDAGTTGNDYGSDVIARAQFFFQNI